MKVYPVGGEYFFSASRNNNQKNREKDNPITRSGEKSTLLAATFIAGLGFGAKLLLELIDGNFVLEDLGNAAGKIVEKQHKNASGVKKSVMKIGAFGGILAMFVGGAALLYTLFKAPNINYNGNINAYKKGKDMDVYIKANKTEKEIYTQMNEKAKNATSEEKAKLQEQYIKMQAAKNTLPDFISSRYS